MSTSIQASSGILHDLRQINTVQPVSNQNKAKEASEASNIQPAKTQPVIVEQEKAYDKYIKTLDFDQINEEATEKLNENLATMREVTKFQDIDYSSDAVSTHHVAKGSWDQLHNSEDNGYAIADSSLSNSEDVTVMVNAKGPKTVSQAVERKVEDSTHGLSRVKDTRDEIEIDGTSMARNELHEQEARMKATLPPEPAPTTAFENYQKDPIHTQSASEVIETLKEIDSDFLRPEIEPYIAPPERPLVPDEVVDENYHTHRPTFTFESATDLKVESIYEKEVSDKLSLQAKARTEGFTTEDFTTQGETQGAPLVMQPQVTQDVVAQPVVETQEVEQTPAVERTQEQPRTKEEPRSQVRPELQSATELAKNTPAEREALPEPVEREAVEFTPQTSEYTPEPVVDTAEFEPIELPGGDFEPQLVEASSQVQETQVPDTTSELPDGEDYFPPLPGSQGVEENPFAEELSTEDFFPPLPGTGATVSEESIEKAVAQEQNQVEVEYTMPEPIEIDVAEDISGIGATSISREEMAFLRTMNPQFAHVDEEVEIREEADEQIRHEPTTSEISHEKWARNAINLGLNSQFMVEVGESPDLTRFEENYLPEELLSLEDYDYELTANRVSDATQDTKETSPLAYYGA